MRRRISAGLCAGAVCVLLGVMKPVAAAASDSAQHPVPMSNALECSAAPRWLVEEGLRALGLSVDTEVSDACVYSLEDRSFRLRTLTRRQEQPVPHSIWNRYSCRQQTEGVRCDWRESLALMKPEGAKESIRVTPVSSVADAAKLFEVIVHAPDQLGGMAVDTQGAMFGKPGIGLELLRRLMTEPVTIERLEFDSRTQFWHAGCEYPSGDVQWILRAPEGGEHRWRIVEALAGNIPM